MSATAWRLDTSDRERAEMAACLNCPLPECYGRRHIECALWDPWICARELEREIWAAVARSRQGMGREREAV